MENSKQKSKPQKPFKLSDIMYNIFWCILLVSVIIGSAFQLERHRHSIDEKQSLQQQVSRQKETNESLKKDLTLYGSDAYIERTASDQLGLVKPDEVIFYNEE